MNERRVVDLILLFRQPSAFAPYVKGENLDIKTENDMTRRPVIPEKGHNANIEPQSLQNFHQPIQSRPARFAGLDPKADSAIHSCIHRRDLSPFRTVDLRPGLDSVLVVWFSLRRLARSRAEATMLFVNFEPTEGRSFIDVSRVWKTEHVGSSEHCPGQIPIFFLKKFARCSRARAAQAPATEDVFYGG